jgi:hypothetical protein
VCLVSLYQACLTDIWGNVSTEFKNNSLAVRRGTCPQSVRSSLQQVAKSIVPVFVVLALSVLPAMARKKTPSAPDPTGKSVKVFILAGQSNMEGKSKESLWNHQAKDPKTKEFFAHLRDGDQWIKRDDIFIKYLDRHGNLTIGYGSRDCCGSEYEFGYVLGEHFTEPVLLIKAAWGGHSLYKNFRPPSAGLPTKELLQAELDKAQKKIEQKNQKHKQNKPLPTMDDIKAPYGASYRMMMNEVTDVMANYQTIFPDLKDKQLELAGFYWFQGFNDQFGESAPGEYKANMKHFIKDVRKDLKAPKLPFVIAAIGTYGWSGMKSPKEGSGTEKVLKGQIAMNDVPEFLGNVKAFETAPLHDKQAAELYPDWKKHFDEWQKVGSDRPYHYLGSAIWYTRIGRTAGEAMLELLKK